MNIYIYTVCSLEKCHLQAGSDQSVFHTLTLTATNHNGGSLSPWSYGRLPLHHGGIVLTCNGILVHSRHCILRCMCFSNLHCCRVFKNFKSTNSSLVRLDLSITYPHTHCFLSSKWPQVATLCVGFIPAPELFKDIWSILAKTNYYDFLRISRCLWLILKTCWWNHLTRWWLVLVTQRKHSRVKQGCYWWPGILGWVEWALLVVQL